MVNNNFKYYTKYKVAVLIIIIIVKISSLYF